MHGQVEIDAQEHAFVLHVHIVERLEFRHAPTWIVILRCERRSREPRRMTARARHPSRRASRAPQDDGSRFQISFPIATAVSIMRLEKPHSLSYHDSTATRLPSMTLVWSMWNTDERG